MIPPPPKRTVPPPPKPRGGIIRINRLFDDAKEMEAYVNTNHPDGRIVKTWAVTQLGCEVELPPKENKKKK